LRYVQPPTNKTVGGPEGNGLSLRKLFKIERHKGFEELWREAGVFFEKAVDHLTGRDRDLVSQFVGGEFPLYRNSAWRLAAGLFEDSCLRHYVSAAAFDINARAKFAFCKARRLENQPGHANENVAMNPGGQ